MPLRTYETPLVRGEYADRPNRFTITVERDGEERSVYLRNSGGMDTTLEPGRAVLCRPVDDPERVTDFDAIAVDVAGTWVTVDATLPNDVVATCVERDLLPGFEDHEVVATEPQLPEEGRADLRLAGPDGEVIVEAKSNTWVEDDVSKFPDRPTERGRRHLRALTDLAADGTDCAVVFVVQRPDADRVRPFREVDPEFADLLAAAREAGVTVRALSTRFDPPTVELADPDLPVEI